MPLRKTHLAGLLGTFSFALITISLLSISAFADSQVRIVRLSDVEGPVQINLNNANAYQKAFLNLPVTQGNRVRTQTDGRAAIEFEDGSSLRLAPNSRVEFPQLSLNESGTKVSVIAVQDGTAYVDYKGAKDGQLTVTFAHEKIAFTHPVHLRIELSDANAAVAVFSGEADVDSPTGTVQVAKNRTAIFDLSKDSSKLAKNLEPDPYDAWDKQQDQYQQRYSYNSTNSVSPYSYGLADLNYYGSYFNSPGYGLMWQPYFAGAGWDPFMDGAWAFYPGSGYGWASAYPWGWMPYHSGSWIFIPGRGYAWQPGGAWTAINARPRVLNAPANFSAPKPPASGQSLVLVNRGPIAVFAGQSSSKLVIRNNSAGLGIPRGGINDLAEISQRVSERGMVTARIHSAPVQAPVMGMSGYGPSRVGTAGPQRSSLPASGSQAGSAGTMHSAGSGGRSSSAGRAK